jgi:nitrogen fixation protein NifX
MKVAFATTDGVHVDEHFGRAGRFVVYEFTGDGYTSLGDRVFAEGRDMAVEGTRGQGALHDDAVQGKVEKLSDCDIIYMTSIGGPSAARLVRKGIMPVKLKESERIEETAVKLMKALQGTPPPWLRRALENRQEERKNENDSGDYQTGERT